MTRPRSELVSPADTPYYHCVSRCVRRAFLCGHDRLTDRDYSHRKAWVLERLRLLGEVFTIDLCAYAVMANHYHLVVHLNPNAADAFTEAEVVTRWGKLHHIPTYVQRYLQGCATGETEARAAKQRIATWRARLADLSWYMRSLNAPIARQANQEDNCKGRFWEGRFKSQAILDEAGLLTCMAYVDLNPLRAGLVDTPEQSADISIHERLRQYKPVAQRKSVASTGYSGLALPRLQPFAGDTPSEATDTIPFNFSDYLQLVDWAGRLQRSDKRGHISDTAPPILQRLGLEADTFLAAIGRQRLSRGTVIGHAASRRRHAQARGRRRLYGPVLSSAA